MASIDDATRTQLTNIETASGRSASSWVALIRESGPRKHGEIRAWLQEDHGLTYGNANLLAMLALKPDDAPAGDDQVAAIYAGKLEPLRPLHDRVIEKVGAFGRDIEYAPKKTYVALRRKKQFAMVGPTTGGRLEIGLNLPDAPIAGRMEAASGMASRRVRISDAGEIDAELVGWLREAYERG